MESSICTVCTISEFFLVCKLWKSSLQIMHYILEVKDIQTLFILECIFGKFNCNFPLFFLTLFLSGLQIVQVTFLVLFCWSINSMSWVSEFKTYFRDVLVLLFIERLICTIFAYPDFFLVCNLYDSGQQIMPHIPDSSIYVQCWYWRSLVVGIFRRVSFNS